MCNRLEIDSKGYINTWVAENAPENTSYFEYEMTYNYWKMIYNQMPASSAEEQTPRYSDSLSAQEVKILIEIKRKINSKISEYYITNNYGNKDFNTLTININSTETLKSPYTSFNNSTILPPKHLKTIKEIEKWLENKESCDIQTAKEYLDQLISILVERKVFIIFVYLYNI